MTMMNDAAARAAANNRMRNLDAMERLVLALGNRTHYAAWLECFPADIVLDGAGGVSREDRTAMAEDESAYDATVKAFAALMIPVLTEISAE